MRATAVAPPFCDPDVPRACGKPILGQVYFIAFTMLMFVVVLNIVVGVVVEVGAAGGGVREEPLPV
jgi:hypothetical protein